MKSRISSLGVARRKGASGSPLGPKNVVFGPHPRPVRAAGGQLIPLLAALFAATAHGQAPAPAAQAAVAPEAAPTAAPAAAPTAVAAAGFGLAVAKAATRWQTAVSKKPRLVSLKGEARTGSVEDNLKSRLKSLGDKTFSNREWKTYWDTQINTAGALAAELAKANAAGGSNEAEIKLMISGLRSWVQLAKAKTANQDVYLKAIETERDAIEDRLEAALDAPTAPKAAAAARSGQDELTPYQARQRWLDDLRTNISQQQTKRALVQEDLKLIDQQMASEVILLDALVKDAELARTERDIARGETRSRTGAAWLQTWVEIAAVADTKLTTLEEEAEHGAARNRARQVEAGLARSQVKFRTERIRELEARYAREGGVGSLAEAAWQTVVDWLTHDSWRIAFGLLLIWLGLKFVLRLLRKGVDVVLARAEGDPEDTADDDHRVLTLATVFQSVVKIALYVIAALLALDQIGVNTAPLLGSVAILGLAISFGSQNLVRDVVNGFFILLENQYAVGEVITVSGCTGTVERITIRSTWVRQANGDLHVLPNGSISTVTNNTRDWSRAIVHVGVGYGADLDQVEAVVNRVGQEMFADAAWQDALAEAPAWVGVTELGDSAVVFRCQARVSPGNQWGVGRELNRRLKVALDTEGIEIPFPQRVVWSKEG